MDHGGSFVGETIVLFEKICVKIEEHTTCALENYIGNRKWSSYFKIMLHLINKHNNILNVKPFYCLYYNGLEVHRVILDGATGHAGSAKNRVEGTSPQLEKEINPF